MQAKPMTVQGRPMLDEAPAEAPAEAAPAEAAPAEGTHIIYDICIRM